MARSPTKVANESDITPVGEDKLDFDDNTLRAIAEVYNNEGNERYKQEDLSNAIHFYTEGIQVNCKDEELNAELYSNRADAYFCLGNYEDSLRDAKLATGFQPLFIRAIVRGTSACVQLSQFEEAITWCEKGLAIDKDNQKLLELRSQSVTELNKLQDAGKEDNANEYDITAATEKTLDNDEANLRAIAECFKNDGNDEFRKKDFRNAIFLYTKGIEVDCKDQELKAKLYNNRAIAHFNLGNFHDSLSDAKAATDLQPSYVKAIVRGASACVQLNQFEEAITWCDMGLAIDKNSQELLKIRRQCVREQSKLKAAGKKATKDQSETQTDNGTFVVKTGRDAKSIRNIKTPIGNHGRDVKISKETADKLHEEKLDYSSGNNSYRERNFKDTIDHLERELEIAKEVGHISREGQAYFNLGNAYYSHGELKKAIDYHERHLKIAKEVGDIASEGKAYANLGCAYRRLGDLKKAIDCHEHHLKIAKEVGDISGEGRAYFNLGNAYRCLGDFKKAIDCHERHLKIAMEVGDISGEGKAYSNLGNAYYSLGDFKKAIDYHERHLKIAKEVGDVSGKGTAYGDLGCAYDSLGDFKKAIDYHERHLKIAKEVGDISGEGAAYGNLGGAYCSVGDFKKAIDYHERCLEIAKEVGDISGEGKAYGNQGYAYRCLGDFKKAIDYHERHLKIARELGDISDAGTAYCNLGIAYRSLGDFKKAIDYHESHLKVAKEVGDISAEGKAYCNLGNSYHSLGDFKKAIDYHERDLKIAKEIGDIAGEGTTYCNLGFAYRCLGDFKKAIDYHERHLKIATEVGDISGKGQAYCNLGCAYQSLGNFKKAIDYHERDLKIAKEVGDIYGEGQAYCNLGCAYSSLGDLKKAIDYHERYLKIAKEVGDISGEGRAYCNLGNACHSLGHFKKAIDYHEHDLKIAKELGDFSGEGKAYGNLGRVYHNLSDFKNAIDYFERALQIATQVMDKVEIGQSFHRLGAVFRSTGSILKATHCFQQSVTTLNDVRDHLVFKDDWKVSLRNLHQDAYVSLWRSLLWQGKIMEALLSAEQGRAQALKDLLEFKYAAKATQVLSGTEIETVADISGFLPCTTVFIGLEHQEVILWILQKGQDVLLRRKQIPDDQVDVNTFLSSLMSTASQEINVRAVLKCEDRSLDSAREKNLTDERSPSEKEQNRSSHLHQSSLSLLYDYVISPVQDLLVDNEVIFVPEGPLCLAPFPAFMDSDSRYLCESFRVRVIPSLTSLKLIADCPADYHIKTGALLVGDPWVQDVTFERTKLQQLPFAQEEVQMIGRILHTTPLIGRQATKNEVLKRLSSVGLVHIAAHGRMETGEIALAPNPIPGSRAPVEEDFVLTMRDVLNIQMRARLVVLSCCHSAHGEIKAEGVVGIARSFLGAGARSVLVSLWAIKDNATMEFMKSFYQHLERGKSASAALNQTMKCMRESDRFNEVKHWAPFVLIGDDITIEFCGKD